MGPYSEGGMGGIGGGGRIYGDTIFGNVNWVTYLESVLTGFYGMIQIAYN